MLLASVAARTSFTHVHYTLPTHMLTHALMPLHTRKHTHTHTNGYTQLAICVIVLYMNIISF